MNITKKNARNAIMIVTFVAGIVLVTSGNPLGIINFGLCAAYLLIPSRKNT